MYDILFYEDKQKCNYLKKVICLSAMFRDIFILFVINTVYIRSTGLVAFPVDLYQNNLLCMRPIGKMTRGSYNTRACTTHIYVTFYVYIMRALFLTVYSLFLSL